jgi:hypothetical protein
MAIFDADRCFHYGSRSATRPRFVLAIQYCTPFALVFPRDWTQALPLSRLATAPGLGRIERLVLGAR